jgi:dynein light chain roadblock-type
MPPFLQGSGTNDVLDETLGRLSKKAGVKATILLDRATGSILKMEGQISSIRTSIGSGSGRNGATKESNGGTMADSGTSMAAGGGFAEDALLSGAGGNDGAPADETKGARQLAGLVWNYVKTSGELVEAIDTEVS